ncbi:hypothetical protein [Oceanobacillus locisalsi]|uniref:Uncharacterized protein n=1 Tax=Oceanobacillus locisalsi TaxID=546107 RepID=A0ABW3NEJ6_9BACI
MDSYLDKRLQEKLIDRFLTEKERLLYRKVIHMEDGIAERALTPEHFMDLLQIESPHKYIAEVFDLSLSELLEVLKEIEKKISINAEYIQAEIRWLDCTNVVSAELKMDKNKRFFYTEGLS